MGEWRINPHENLQDVLDVFFGQFVVVRDFDAFFRGIYEQDVVVRLRLLQHHDACCDRCTEEQVFRKLDHTIDVVVVYKIFPDLLFCSASVEYSREAYNRRNTILRKP